MKTKKPPKTFTCASCKTPNCPLPACKVGGDKLCQTCAGAFMSSLRGALR